MGEMPAAEHPIWSLFKYFITMSFITLILWISATNFDHTELKSLGVIASGLGGAKIAEYFGKKLSL